MRPAIPGRSCWPGRSSTCGRTRSCDAAPRRDEAGGAGPQGPAKKPGMAAPWQVWLNFQKLDLAASPAPDFSDFRLFAAGQGGTVLQAHGTAGGVALTIAPSGPAARALTLQGQDAGLLLRAMAPMAGCKGAAWPGCALCRRAWQPHRGHADAEEFSPSPGAGLYQDHAGADAVWRRRGHVRARPRFRAGDRSLHADRPGIAAGECAGLFGFARFHRLGTDRAWTMAAWIWRPRWCRPTP